MREYRLVFISSICFFSRSNSDKTISICLEMVGQAKQDGELEGGDVWWGTG